MRVFTIGKNDEGTRVDRFVTKIVPRLPLSLLYKSIRLKRIKLNKKRCEISTRLKEGDLLELYIADEFFSEATTKCPFLSAPKEIDILYEDENIQAYIDDQNAIPCKEGDFDLASQLDGMTEYIEAGNMTDYQDHYYPSEMAVDAQIQTFLINKDVDAFLKKFDSDWMRYNRDIIREVQEYEEENGND